MGGYHCVPPPWHNRYIRIERFQTNWSFVFVFLQEGNPSLEPLYQNYILPHTRNTILSTVNRSGNLFEFSNMHSLVWA